MNTMPMRMIEALSASSFAFSWLVASVAGSSLFSINVNTSHLLLYSFICLVTGVNFIPIINKWFFRDAPYVFFGLYLLINMGGLFAFFLCVWPNLP